MQTLAMADSYLREGPNQRHSLSRICMLAIRVCVRIRSLRRDNGRFRALMYMVTQCFETFKIPTASTIGRS